MKKEETIVGIISHSITVIKKQEIWIIISTILIVVIVYAVVIGLKND